MINYLYRSPSIKRRRKSPSPCLTKVQVSRLTRNVTKEHVQEIFSTYGAVRNVDLVIDRARPHLSRGFAYIEYENSDDAEKALRYMDCGQISNLRMNPPKDIENDNSKKYLRSERRSQRKFKMKLYFKKQRNVVKDEILYLQSQPLSEKIKSIYNQLNQDQIRKCNNYMQ